MIGEIILTAVCISLIISFGILFIYLSLSEESTYLLFLSVLYWLTLIGGFCYLIGL